MTPYYDRDGITIYCGDCRDVLPRLGKVDFVVSDPPYGISYKPLRGSNGSKMWGDETVTGDDEEFDPTFILALGAKTILWGANHYANKLQNSGGWIVWDKTPDGIREGFIYSHCELAWTNILTRVHKFSCNWHGNSRGGNPFLHPTQKPLSLMEYCIKMSDGVIVDPFMGSGTTLVAAKALGRKAIGIEIREKYCEIAVKRLAQGELFGIRDE